MQFNSNSLAVIDSDVGGSGNIGNIGNIGNEPTPSTVLFFLTGSAVLNYAPGFNTGFSFYYTTVNFSGTAPSFKPAGNSIVKRALSAKGFGKLTAGTSVARSSRSNTGASAAPVAGYRRTCCTKARAPPARRIAATWAAPAGKARWRARARS